MTAADGIVVEPKVFTRRNAGAHMAVFINGEKVDGVIAACPDEGWIEKRDPQTKVTTRRYLAFEMRDLRTGEVVARTKS